jgi:hypothetical protein
MSALVWVTPARQIGVMFGNPETTAGGNALKYYSSVRIDIRKKETLSEQETAYANRVRAKVVKNKVAAPHKCEGASARGAGKGEAQHRRGRTGSGEARGGCARSIRRRLLRARTRLVPPSLPTSHGGCRLRLSAPRAGRPCSRSTTAVASTSWAA